MKKNLYKISQNENVGCDTYDSAIVCASSENEARQMYPGTEDGKRYLYTEINNSNWADPENIKVELIGKANREIQIGVILASYNAG